MRFDVEMSYTQFIRKQIIIVNYSSQLKTRESALILIVFSTIQLPSTLSVPLWFKQWNAACYCNTLTTAANRSLLYLLKNHGQVTSLLYAVHIKKPFAPWSWMWNGKGFCSWPLLLLLGKSLLLHLCNVLHRPAVWHAVPALRFHCKVLADLCS